MAYSPISFIASNYRDYKNWWLKAYEPGTTTPKLMADDTAGTTTVAKYEINKNGFFVSSGGALIIPHIENNYDLWIFPTESEADLNDTTSAEKVADNSLPSTPIAETVSTWQFTTLAEAIAETRLSIGDRIELQGRSMSNDGQSYIYIVVAGGSGTDTGYNYITTSNGFQLMLLNSNSKYLVGSQAGFGRSFMHQVNANRRDVYLMVQSDSTGDATDEWVYLTTQLLANEFPTHTINYRVWNESIEDYDTPLVLQNGTGTKTLYVYNGAKAGSTCVYFTGSRKTNAYGGLEFDLIIQNYGHNQTSGGTLNKAIYRLTESISQVIQIQPKAEIVLTLQNIDTSLEDFSALQVQATEKVAQMFGLPAIDIRSLFRWKQLTGDLNEWMGDSVHPNEVGHRAWASHILDGLRNSEKQTPNMFNSLSEVKTSLGSNAFFDSWEWDAATPTGWTTVNANILKDLTVKETLGWSVKCEGTTGSTGSLKQNLNSLLQKRPKGSGLTFMARVYRLGTNANNDAGRVELVTDLGSEATSAYPEIFDDWSWSIVHMEADKLDGATTLSGSVYTGIVGDFCYVDRVFIGYSRLPHEPRVIAETKLTYYDPANVGTKNQNVVNVVDDSVEMISTTDSFPNWYLDVFGLTPNEKYTLTYTYTGGGVGTVLVRENTGDSGTVLKTVSPLSTGLVEFNPTLDSCSIQISNNSGTEPFTLSDIVIIKG